MFFFREALKQYKLKKSLTYTELAKKIKIPTSTVGMYIRGKRNPSIQKIMEIFQRLNIDLPSWSEIKKMEKRKKSITKNSATS